MKSRPYPADNSSLAELHHDSEDAAQLACIAAGDRAAFEQLFRAYYERLFRFVLRVTGRLNLVEDVINDTMLVVWNKAGEYRAVSKPSTWIFGIAYRKSLKALSREYRSQQPWIEADDAELEAPGILDRAGLHSAIRAALMHLSPEQRAVVELTFYFNRSYLDIAQILDCPVGTVKSRMFHAREHLRPLLAHLAGDQRP